MNLAPIALFTYKRLTHLKKTLSHLESCKFASSSKLYIFSDCNKNSLDYASVSFVRDYLKSINGFLEVEIIERKTNYGLRRNIVSGLNYLFDKYEKVIVLEDDLIVSKSFLEFMNKALDLYLNDEKVCQISGYSYLEKILEKKKIKLETYFLKGSDCLAWGTWKDSWKNYHNRSKELLEDLNKKNLVNKLDRNGKYLFSRDLENTMLGFNYGWAINFLSINIILNKYTLYPYRSLALHIGNDNSSTNVNFKDSIDPYKVKLDNASPNLEKIEVKELDEIGSAYEEWLTGFYNKSKRYYFQKLIKFLKVINNIGFSKISNFITSIIYTINFLKYDQKLFKYYLNQSNLYVEFASGISTMNVIFRPIKIFSRETNFIKFLFFKILILIRIQTKSSISFFNIGFLEKSGKPLIFSKCAKKRLDNFSNYSNFPSIKNSFKKNKSGALIFINGQFKLACVLKTIRYLNKKPSEGNIIAIDNFKKINNYDLLLRFIRLLRKSKNIYYFEILNNIDKEKLDKFISEYELFID